MWPRPRELVDVDGEASSVTAFFTAVFLDE
jgi:hypothetical protein